MEVVSGSAAIDDLDDFLSGIDQIAADHGLTVQVFDGRYVVDRNHLRRAVDLATRAMERGEMIADDRGVEILLYAAGRRQINQAFEIGVSPGDCSVVAVVVDLDGHDWQADTAPATTDERKAASAVADLLDGEKQLGKYDRERVCEYFEITETELAATRGDVSDLVRERVALLVVER